MTSWPQRVVTYEIVKVSKKTNKWEKFFNVLHKQMAKMESDDFIQSHNVWIKIPKFHFSKILAALLQSHGIVGQEPDQVVIAIPLFGHRSSNNMTSYLNLSNRLSWPSDLWDSLVSPLEFFLSSLQNLRFKRLSAAFFVYTSNKVDTISNRQRLR